MKNSKLRRILLTLACAVLLVSLSVGATLAYLTSTTNVVENTFTVGKVKIDLDEADVDQYGVVIAGNDRVEENEYKLLPGHTYTKDPIVYVEAGSEQCYVFVKVVNQIAAIEDSTNTIAAQIAANDWLPLMVDGNRVDNVFYYETIVDAREVTTDIQLPVFESFKISGAVLNGVNEGEEKVEGQLYITDYTTEDNDTVVTIQAYAIQSDGFATAADAWKTQAGNFQ